MVPSCPGILCSTLCWVVERLRCLRALVEPFQGSEGVSSFSRGVLRDPGLELLNAFGVFGGEMPLIVVICDDVAADL